MEDTEFVEDQLFMLERIGCIRKASKKPLIVMPLSVVFSNKKRLIVDGSRNLNPFIKDLKVNLSHLEAANAGLTPGSYMMTCDLESGYYQVPIHKSHRKFLGVAWTNKKGKKVYFEWQVLFLGIKSAVHVFTKCLRPHIRFCQLWGISVIIYIDDQRIDATTSELCQIHSDFAESCLALAGWCLKPGKGIRAPTQVGVFLGMGHNLETLYYFIPEEKLEKIVQLGLWIVAERRIPLRKLASYYGKVSSCRLALGPVTSLLCRSGQALIARLS
jgi:hypothetical protein